MNMRGSLSACSDALGAKRWMRVEVVIVRWNLDMVMLDIDVHMAYESQVSGRERSYVLLRRGSPRRD